MFEKNSRYAKTNTYETLDGRGRRVKVVATPTVAELSLRGVHLRKQGQRLDHLAFHYLDQPTHFWRIAHMNQVMLPDAIAQADEIGIPKR